MNTTHAIRVAAACLAAAVIAACATYHGQPVDRPTVDISPPGQPGVAHYQRTANPRAD